MRPQPHTKSIGSGGKLGAGEVVLPWEEHTPVGCQCTASSETIHTSNVTGLDRFYLGICL